MANTADCDQTVPLDAALLALALSAQVLLYHNIWHIKNSTRFTSNKTHKLYLELEH